MKNKVWFIAWLVVGFGMVVLGWVGADYYGSYHIERAFRFGIPEEAAREQLFEWIEIFPWIPLIYALVGVWFFRRRGCLAVACGGIFGCCPWLALWGCDVGR